MDPIITAAVAGPTAVAASDVVVISTASSPCEMEAPRD